MKIAGKLRRLVKSRQLKNSMVGVKPAILIENKVAQVIQNHPYTDLPDQAYWKKGVAAKNPLSLENLYSKKFDIKLSDRIVTAGSCFAQHIARHMKSSGFNFCDYEPAPFDFPSHLKQDFHYGVYSARYCNIYTVRQLIQTFQRVYGTFEPQDDVWETDDGQCYDAFRPAVEPGPFSDHSEIVAARITHFKSCRRVFEECDVFIFTLGLTEGWVSKKDGAVYPLCPGTIAGKFDPDLYYFHNFTFQEIYEDFKKFRDLIRKVNPTVKFILTVSPVPLTATKTGNHVAVATSYSKSVLRAVAGQLTSEHDDIDYFPSYEIIASPIMRGMFFEPNMRSVNPAGVNYVMTHFFEQHSPFDAKSNQKDIRHKSQKTDNTDVACEELLMEQTFK